MLAIFYSTIDGDARMNIDKSNLRPIEFRCVDCGETFVFSIADQLHYLSKGFHPPKRCKKCRKHNRETLENHPPIDKTLRCKTSSFFEDAQIYGPRENVKTNEYPPAFNEWDK